MKSVLTIPCRHTIIIGYIIDQISNRFLRVMDDPHELPNKVIVSNESIPVEKTRNSFLARIDPYVNLYGKNKQVGQILDDAVINLEGLQIRTNQGMPPTIAQQDHQFLFPSHNVMSGRQSTKRKNKCSECGSTEHNVRSCPFKQDKKNRLYGF